MPSTPRISGLVFTESMGDGLQLREEIPDDEEVHIFELEREIVSYYSRYFYSTGKLLLCCCCCSCVVLCCAKMLHN